MTTLPRIDFSYDHIRDQYYLKTTVDNRYYTVYFDLTDIEQFISTCITIVEYVENKPFNLTLNDFYEPIRKR